MSNNISKKENFYLYKEEKEYLGLYMQKHNLKKSEALRNIILEHKNNSKLTSDYIYDVIAKKLSEYIKNDIGKELKQIKNTSKASDKSGQIIIELLNYHLLNSASESDTLVTTDQIKLPILDMAEKEVNSRIHRNFYIKKGSLD